MTTSSVIYSDIEDGWEGIGNIQANPMFADEEAENFQLTPISPCVNFGTPDTTGLNLPLLDLLGNPRIYDNRIDLGCYEYQDVSSDDQEEVVGSYQLSAYPNPFNNSGHNRNAFTTISFELAEQSNGSLSVFNLKGQMIKKWDLVNLSKGENSIIWDGKDSNSNSVPSGIYFYQLRTSDTVQTKKMMLIK